VLLTIGKRLSALALILLTGSGNAAVCAGWMSAPEARMACCASGHPCPMHHHESSNSSVDSVTQGQADACCASSEEEKSSQSGPTVVVVVSSPTLDAGLVLPAPVPTRVRRDGWRAAVPAPSAAIPKHVLLSVFLV
jgi:hypothetical protein